MNNKEFKKIFNEIAKTNGFESAFGGWFKMGSECIAVLDLQKSNYGNYYQLNVKIFVQGMFGNIYVKCKDLVKKEIGDIQNGEPKEYRDIFNFNVMMNDANRKHRLEMLFANFINPFTYEALTRTGIRKLEERGEIFLLPSVKRELEKG